MRETSSFSKHVRRVKPTLNNMNNFPAKTSSRLYRFTMKSSIALSPNVINGGS